MNEKKNGRNIKIDEVFADLSPLKNTSYKSELIKEVKNEKIRKLIANSPKFSNGTLLKISSLRDPWEGQSIKKIYENLELLSPPDAFNRWKIYFFDNSEPDKYGLVNTGDFSDYDYKLVAKYKKNKNRVVDITIHRNEFDLSRIDNEFFDFPEMKEFPYDKKTFKKETFTIKTSFKELLRGFEDPRNIGDTVGDFQFTFYFLKNSFTKEDRERFKYKEFLGDRGSWLSRFGGIKLYRDSFRIRPYGEIGTQTYDWLGLGERHGQNPAGVARKGSRVRSNQVAGFVKLSRLSNPFLEDKSSREGLQESETFELFKNLLLGIIRIQENDRSTIAYHLNEIHQLLNPDEKALEESKEIAEQEDDSHDTPEEAKAKTTTLKKGIKASQRKLEEKEDELAISRAMATAGIMIASFSHEFNGIKNDLLARSNELEKYVKDVIDPFKIKRVPARKNPLKLIEELRKQDDKIRQWISFAIDLTKKDRRRNRKVDLVKYFDSFAGTWQKLFKQRDVKFSFGPKTQGQYELRISELDLDSIFDNLITNSIEAFQRNGFVGKRQIAISFKITQGNILIVYSDSGPGIPKEYKTITDIFIPFETSKKDDLGNDIGTGLGMWLVKSTIDSNKGQVELLRPKTGFEIKIILPKFKQ